MAQKNPSPISPEEIGSLPDGRYVAVSERLIGEGVTVRPAKIGKAYLEKATGQEGKVSVSYTNRRNETAVQELNKWLKKYNDEYFNLVDQEAVSVPHEAVDALAGEVSIGAGVTTTNSVHPVAGKSISITVTVTGH